MRSRALPTVDLYFLNSCGRWVDRWWRRGPVEQLGANCFRCGDRLLLIRQDRPDVMARVHAWTGTLIYLIDDDIDGAAASPGLPSSYRERLTRFAGTDFDQLLRRADHLVVSSEALADRFRDDARVRAELHRIDPFWSLPIADLRHFEVGEDVGLDVVHLGTASHAGALDQAIPAILSLLDRFPRSRFTFFGKPGAHPRLALHERARRLTPMSWPRYRRWLARQRFHLALYPLESSAFDRARSCNKLLEHGVVGAVGVYPREWAPAGTIGDGAILAPTDPRDWEPTLIDAAAQRATLARRAQLAAGILGRLNRPDAQSRFWSDMLAVERGR